MYIETSNIKSSLFSVEREASGSYVLIGLTQISPSQMAFDVRKLNAHLAYDANFSEDGMLLINQYLAYSGNDGVKIYIGDGNYYLPVSYQYGKIQGLVKISADGKDVVELNRYSIFNSAKNTTNCDVVFKEGRPVVVGDYWSYETINSQNIYTHYIGIDDGNVFLKFTVPPYYRIDASYIAAEILNNGDYLIASTTSVMRVDSTGKSVALGNTPKYIEKMSNVAGGSVFVFGYDSAEVFLSSGIHSVTVKKIDANGAADASFGIAGGITLNLRNDYFACATQDGGMLLVWKEAIHSMGLKNEPITSYVEHCSKFNKNGGLVKDTILDLEISYCESQIRYDQYSDSVYVTLIESEQDSLQVDPAIANHHISFFKIDSSAVVSAGFEMPTYLNETKDRYFSNGIYYASDLNGNAGTAAKILGAVFGQDAVQNKQYVGIGLDLLDKGMDYSALAGLAVNAAGLTTPDQIVSTLWKNVMRKTATDSDKAPFIAWLEHGMTPGELAKLAAETAMNAENIDLIGLASTGLEYLPVQ